VKLDLDLDNLNIRSVYEFVQANMRISDVKAKKFIQSLLKEAIRSGEYSLDETTLDLFRDAVKVVGMGSPPSFVLTAVLLKLLARKKRAV
jgi:DNA polymerase-3 subunit delta'